MQEASAKKWLSIIAKVYYVLIPLVGIFSVYSIFMFDAPGEPNPATNLLYYSLVSFPVVCILAGIVVVIMYVLDWNKLACIFSLTPIINIILSIIAIIWLEISFGGKFKG